MEVTLVHRTAHLPFIAVYGNNSWWIWSINALDIICTIVTKGWIPNDRSISENSGCLYLYFNPFTLSNLPRRHSVNDKQKCQMWNQYGLFSPSPEQVKGFFLNQNTQYWKWICYRTTRYAVCRHIIMCPLFSLENVQAGGVKGLNLPLPLVACMYRLQLLCHQPEHKKKKCYHLWDLCRHITWLQNCTIHLFIYCPYFLTFLCGER